MTRLAVLVFALSLLPTAPSFAQNRDGPRGGNPLQRAEPDRPQKADPDPLQRPNHGGNAQRPAPPRGGPHAVPRANWRHFVPGRTTGNHRPFRFRGNTFVFIGAPIYTAPWLSYPYVWDEQWGPRYYDPSQPGDFLFFCSSPQGYSWEVSECSSGWWPIVPTTYSMPPG